MEYGLTAATIKRAKISKLPAGEETDYRFVWEISYVTIVGKKLLLISNVDSRYTMVFSDLKPMVWKDMKGFIHDAIHLALEREGFKEEEIERYFSLGGEEILTKTHGRKAMGGLNRLTVELPYMNKELVGGMFQFLITEQVNHTFVASSLHPEKSCFVPRELFEQRIRDLLRDNKE